MSNDDIENIGSNTSDNRHFDDVVASRFSRRSVLKGGIGLAALSFFGGAQLAGANAASARAVSTPPSSLLGFTSVSVSVLDDVVVPPGYKAQVLIPWGTPLFSGGPQFKADASNTADEQAQQLGMSHDGMHYFPINGSNVRGLLVLNHEATDQVLLFKDGDIDPADSRGRNIQKVKKSLAAHGVTVIEVQMIGGRWTQVDSPLNRRITGDTPVTFSGPVGAKDDRLKAKTSPKGTLNNCSMGYTPWGTYLACEENFNGYFGTEDTSFTPTAEQARYGIRREPATLPEPPRPNPAAGTVQSFGYKWHLVDPRFYIAANPREFNRFGWVTEIDPFDPDSKPVKRTALGRFKHESAAVTVAPGGHVVVYSGDDENLDYVYKYVSARPWSEMRAAGISPLDEGTLYVAQFLDGERPKDGKGNGRWLPLVHGQRKLTTDAGWKDQADVLLRTRLAADALRATKLHRPEWVAVDETSATKDVYLTLTNGRASTESGRTHEAAEVSPRASDTFGTIVRWTETGGDARATTFDWDLFLLAGDSTKDSSTTINGDEFGSPDGIWADPDGRIWIQTDVSNGSQRRTSYSNLGNNMMLAADPKTREVKRFLVGPNGCEITGVTTTPDQTSMFINVQHPGEETRAFSEMKPPRIPTPEKPGAVSDWPDGGGLSEGKVRPRSATVVITKNGGGIIGT